MCSTHATVREIIHALVAGSDRVTVLDMEASLEHLKRGTIKYIDTLCVVMEPYYRSLETAIRIQRLATELGVGRILGIANKVKNSGDQEAIQRFCEKNGFSCLVTIPFDDRVTEADRAGRSVIDFDGESVVIKKMYEFADLLMKI